jgi:hypothetical protein
MGVADFLYNRLQHSQTQKELVVGASEHRSAAYLAYVSIRAPKRRTNKLFAPGY